MLDLNKTIEEVENDVEFLKLFDGATKHIQIKVCKEEIEWREQALFYLKRYQELINRIKEV